MRFQGTAFLITRGRYHRTLDPKCLQLLQEVHQLTHGNWQGYDTFHGSTYAAIGFPDSPLGGDVSVLEKLAKKHGVAPFYSFQNDPARARSELARQLDVDWLKASKPSALLLNLLV